MNRDDINGALMAHDYVCREIESAEEMQNDSEWSEGHINGLKEARNKIEQAIMEMAEE